MTCKNCLHVAVCGRHAATGGRVRECEHFAGGNIRDMNDRKLAWLLSEWYAKEAVLSLRDKGVTPSATEIKEVTERIYMTWLRWLTTLAEVDDGN